MTEPQRRPAFRLEEGPTRVERDVEEELDFHLRMRIDALVTGGMDPTAAREWALQRFGDVTQVRADCLAIDREQARLNTRANLLDDLRRDLRFALRTLRQHWGFTAIVLLILAVGIGANTAIFTLIDALLLRPLPVPHPETLVMVGDPRRTGSVSLGTPRADLVSFPLYQDLRNASHVVNGLYATGRADQLDVLVAPVAGSVDASGDPEHPRGRFVSGNYFSVLQVPAYAGRTFSVEEDHVAGADPVVVISYGYWQRRFAGDRTALGRTLSVNGTPLTIIGIGPPSFTGDIVGQPIDLWMPLMMHSAIFPHVPWMTDRGVSWLLMMGRLAPGVSLAQARAALVTLESRTLLEHAIGGGASGIQRQLRLAPPQVQSGWRGFSYYRSVYASALLTVMAAVGLVLLVVCANVANLLLARAAARSREMSVRMALGAGRARLLRQLITESLMLSTGGALLGLLLAMVGSRALLRLAGASTTLPLDTGLDARVLGFTALLTVLTALAFGIAPALRATRMELATALRAGGRSVMGAAGRPGRPGTGSLLVVTQVALSMLLLVATGMLVRSTQRLERADVGVARDRLLIASIDAERSGYSGDRLAALYRDLLMRVGQVPGVVSVSLSENGLFGGTESGTIVQVPNFTARADSDSLVAYDDVGPGYFATVGAHILRGRDIEARDAENASKVMVLNETMAHFYFPQGDAIGQHIAADSANWEVVGVVRDIEEHGLRNPPSRRLYYPTLQTKPMPGYFRLEVRATGDPASLVQPVQRTLRAADPSLVVLGVEPLTDLIRDSISQDRVVAQVVTFFGFLALVLAALGLYGVLAYATLRRTSEFGLRMALGARPIDLIGMVLREALTLVGAGVMVGLPLAFAASHLLRDRLYGISVLDPPSLGVAALVLGLAAAVAGYLPARRAARIAPLEALRAE